LHNFRETGLHNYQTTAGQLPNDCRLLQMEAGAVVLEDTYGPVVLRWEPVLPDFYVVEWLCRSCGDKNCQNYSLP